MIAGTRSQSLGLVNAVLAAVTAPDPNHEETVRQLAAEITPEALDDAASYRPLWVPAFPSVAEVDTAAALIPAQPCGQVQEGPDWRITVTPGRVVVWTKDEARAERTINRQLDAGCVPGRWDDHDGQHDLDELLDDDEDLDESAPQRGSTREITSWSRKSRANMCARFSDLDYWPLFTDPTRIPAMVTLTYPGDWLTVAPNGKTAKKHLDKLRKRYERKFGEVLRCLWKLEFQRRGAPHFHLLMNPPHMDPEDEDTHFKKWLSRTWADIVAHPDPEERERHRKAGTGLDYAEGMRASDPRRVAVYFSKHGSFKAKEYQNCVPEPWQEPGQGPGRFWGYWGLKPVTATTAVSGQVGTDAGRIIRRYSRAQRVTRETRRPRVKGGRVLPAYHDVMGVAGAQLIRAYLGEPDNTYLDGEQLVQACKTKPLRYRCSRTRAVRAKQNRGWIAVNNGPAFATQLAASIYEQREQRHQATDCAEFTRAGWDTPLTRARRLPPSPRRDALIQRLTVTATARYI